ncbi:hypothetical protein R4576_18085 [Acinetobacter baumannii]|nr:hypothetical protein [Acinetobacter baumannii]
MSQRYFIIGSAVFLVVGCIIVQATLAFLIVFLGMNPKIAPIINIVIAVILILIPPIFIFLPSESSKLNFLEKTGMVTTNLVVRVLGFLFNIKTLLALIFIFLLLNYFK